MSNFKIGDVVIIKPGTRYDGRFLHNPNYKIGVGIVISPSEVKWFDKTGRIAQNSYSFNHDLSLLSEDQEALEFWKELPEKLLNDLEYYLILDKIDKSKIYFKDLEVKNVNHILNELLIDSQTSKRPTYYKYNNKYYQQCAKGKYRSFDDILLICKTYFPSVKVETVFKKLLLLNNTKSYVLNGTLRQQFGYCGDITKIRYIANYSISITSFYINALSRSQGNSKYSWKDLFKMININNIEELKEFYLKNLKDEI